MVHRYSSKSQLHINHMRWLIDFIYSVLNTVDFMHTAISRIDRDILPLFTRACNLFSTINVAVISQIDLPTTIDKTIDKLHLWHFKHGGKD